MISRLDSDSDHDKMSAQQELAISSSGKKNALIDVLENWKKSILESSQKLPLKSNSDLREDAKTFFRCFSMSRKVDAGSGVVLETRPAQEEALGRLLQELGGAFTADHPRRLRALYVLLGAIEGCNDIAISDSSLVLIGNFLSVHCGPILDDEYEEDYDSMIRDVSVQALTALVETPTASSSETDVAQSLQSRVNFAIKGVERRCAAPELVIDQGGMEISSYGFDDGGNMHQDIRGGLSTLPRSKRSLCFDLLRSAVSGVSKVNDQIQSSSLQLQQQESALLAIVQQHFIDFTSFVTRCIPGESDPRCLMQLLELLHATQTCFHGWFATADTSRTVFPIEDVFDSVAPYYPIQFTPPPNNVHGITRDGLHTELISVLTCTKMDAPAREYQKPTMLGCSLGLFLEQLVPPSDEESPGALEKLEALECLSGLLFPTRNSGGGSTSECGNLEPELVGKLSTALRKTHDEASMAVGQSGSKREEEKLLADTCRSFVSKIASELEKSPNPGLWEAFVAHPLDNERKKIESSPSYSNTSIAYAACLAASGGPKTLRTCLSKVLQPLLDFVTDNWQNDSEDVFSAVRGIGAFLSSTQVSLVKMKKEGVELSPHPLEPYSSTACYILLKMLESDDPPLSWSMLTATTQAFEWLLVTSTEEQLQCDEIKSRVIMFLLRLLDNVIIQGQQTENKEEYSTYLIASSRVLGKLLGIAMDNAGLGVNDCLSKSILFSKEVEECVSTKIFPALLDCDTSGDADIERDRFKLGVLATASSSNSKLAKTVVLECVERLNTSLKSDMTSSTTLKGLNSLSYIVRNCEGNNVIMAFHENPVVDKILDTLSRRLAAAHTRESISQIALPPTIKEKEALDSKVRIPRDSAFAIKFISTIDTINFSFILD